MPRIEAKEGPFRGDYFSDGFYSPQTAAVLKTVADLTGSSARVTILRDPTTGNAIEDSSGYVKVRLRSGARGLDREWNITNHVLGKKV